MVNNIMESCSPGKGKTYLTIGQDLFSIQEYVVAQYNYSLHHDLRNNGVARMKTMSSFAPAASMFYTDLEELRGLRSPIDYGSGIEYADGLKTSIFPSTEMGLQIGLWLNGSDGCEKIVNGKMENQLSILSEYLQTNQFSAIFLRVGYEFDNPFFGYSSNPPLYVDAFRYIVRYLRASLSDESLLKAKFVWHSWAAPRQDGVTLEDFYPGDEYVDWIGMSVFQQVYPWSSNGDNGYVNWGGDESDIEEVLKFAKIHMKPTMIAESTPFGGINLNDTNTRMFNDTDPWDRWFGKVIALIETHDIDMWSYINCQWDSQPMWHNIGFGDTRLQTNDYVMKKWQHFIIKSKGNQTFLMGNTMKCGISEENQIRDTSSSQLSLHRQHHIIDVVQIAFFVLCIYFVFFLVRNVFQASERVQLEKYSHGTVDEHKPLLHYGNS